MVTVMSEPDDESTGSDWSLRRNEITLPWPSSMWTPPFATTSIVQESPETLARVHHLSRIILRVPARMRLGGCETPKVCAMFAFAEVISSAGASVRPSGMEPAPFVNRFTRSSKYSVCAAAQVTISVVDISAALASVESA